MVASFRRVATGQHHELGLGGSVQTPTLWSRRPGFPFTRLDDRLRFPLAHKPLPNPHDLPLAQAHEFGDVRVNPPAIGVIAIG